MNAAKSELTGETISIEKLPSDDMQYHYEEIVETLNGKTRNTNNVSVSDDGKTLTFDSIATGSRVAAKTIYDRAN